MADTPQAPIPQPGKDEPINALVGLDTIEISNVSMTGNGQRFAVMKSAAPEKPTDKPAEPKPVAKTGQLPLPNVRSNRMTRVMKGIAEDLSFQERTSRVSNLVSEKFAKPDAADPSWKHYPWVTELYLDRAIFQLDGENFQVTYEMQGDDPVLTSDAVEVLHLWKPVTAEGEAVIPPVAPVPSTTTKSDPGSTDVHVPAPAPKKKDTPTPPPADTTTKEAPVADPEKKIPPAPEADPVPAKKDDPAPVAEAEPVELAEGSTYSCGACGAENTVAAKVNKGEVAKGHAHQIAGVTKAQWDKLEEPVRKSLLSAHKAAAAAQAIAKAEQEKTRTAEFVAKAAGYKHLGTSATKLGLTLKGISDKAPEHLADVETLLRAADAQIAKGGLFQVNGHDAPSSEATDAAGRLDAIAKSIVTAEKLSYAKAYGLALERNPDLYTQYEAEKPKK